jgi:hypothetical protein
MVSRSRLRHTNTKSTNTNPPLHSKKKKIVHMTKTKVCTDTNSRGSRGGIFPSKSSTDKKNINKNSIKKNTLTPTSMTTMTTNNSTSVVKSTNGKECKQCGSSLYLDGVGTVSKALPYRINNGKEHCLVCDYVAFRKLQRECVHCKDKHCDFFCEWCGNAFHTKCALILKEKIKNKN